MTGETAAATGPLISIIVAVRNGADTLARCLESIARQSYRRIDLVIVDGGSTDTTPAIIEQYRALVGARVSEPDHGVYDAWNKGLRLARGDWICFLGADDYLWDERVLETMAQALSAAPAGIRVVYGSMIAVSAAGEVLLVSGEPWPSLKSSFADLPLLPHPGMMHRRSLFEAHGVFDTSFRIAGDYELLLREFKSGDAVFVPGLKVAGLQVGGMSSTRRGMRLALMEVRRAQRMHGIARPGRRWLLAFARMLAREALFTLLGERLARKTLDGVRRLAGRGRFWTADR